MLPEDKRRIQEQARITRDLAEVEHGYGSRKRRAAARLKEQASRPEVELGRKGGLSRSDFKVRAARWNLAKANAARKASGRLGGRPKKIRDQRRAERAA